MAERKLKSWVDTFIADTANLHSPTIFRKWTAISTLAAVLEQKVWLTTSRPMYPNLYVWLIAHPGVGKSRTIAEGRHYVQGIPDFHLAPISMTFASLVDKLVKSKRTVIRPEEDMLEYNSMYICADELGAFIHKYDNDMIDGLSAFYDTAPYDQTRRTSEINIKIKSPQLNIICGSTPQNLTQLMPDKAWGQGFTSRLILIFSDERIVGDDFEIRESTHAVDLIHDLEIINGIVGKFEVTEAYRTAVNHWRSLGEPPVPNHPKLIHYVTRRRAHLYKLSMIAALDKSNALILTVDDFNTAMGWLLEAESQMFEIFKAGATNADAQAMEEILHLIKINDKGQGVSEERIRRFARDRIPLQSILRIIEIMEGSGQIVLRGRDRVTKLRWYSAAPENDLI